MTRVWAYSQCTGTNLVTMLALADWADDDGLCWPSLPQLAKKSRVTIGQVCKVLTVLESLGELHRERSSGGRNKRTRYRVSVTENTLTGNSVADNSVVENSVIQASKTLSPVRGALNRHRTVNNSARTKPARSSAPDPRVKILISAFSDKYFAKVGSRPTITGKEAKALQGLLAAGHDVLAIETIMDRYFANNFYSQIGFDAAGFAKAFNRLNSAGAKKRHNYENGAFPSL